MATFYQCIRGDSSDFSSVSVQAAESKMGDAEGSGEEGSGKKKSKFKSFKKFFGKKKRKDSIRVTDMSGLKQSQSTSDMTAAEAVGTDYDSEEEDGSHKSIMGSRALSHDSIFLSETTQESNRPVRVFSQENVSDHIKALQLKLQENIKLGPPPRLIPTKKMDDTGTSSEDDGLPRSPPEMFSLHEDVNRSLTARFSDPSKHLSSLSLGGTGSEEDEQASLGPSSRPLSPTLKQFSGTSCPVSPLSQTGTSGVSPQVSFDSPPQFTSHLDNAAARHKLSIKPRNQRSGSRRPALNILQSSSESGKSLHSTVEETEAVKTKEPLGNAALPNQNMVANLRNVGGEQPSSLKTDQQRKLFQNIADDWADKKMPETQTSELVSPSVGVVMSQWEAMGMQERFGHCHQVRSSDNLLDNQTCTKMANTSTKNIRQMDNISPVKPKETLLLKDRITHNPITASSPFPKAQISDFPLVDISSVKEGASRSSNLCSSAGPEGTQLVENEEKSVFGVKLRSTSLSMRYKDGARKELNVAKRYSAEISSVQDDFYSPLKSEMVQSKRSSDIPVGSALRNFEITKTVTPEQISSKPSLTRKTAAQNINSFDNYLVPEKQDRAICSNSAKQESKDSENKVLNSKAAEKAVLSPKPVTEPASAEPAWISMARLKQRGFQEQSVNKEEKAVSQDDKVDAGKQTKEKEQTKHQSEAKGSKLSPLVCLSMNEETRQESKTELKELHLKVTTQVHQVAADTPPQVPDKDENHQVSRELARSPSVQPSWMELAKKKSQAWNDMPQSIK